MPLGFRSGRSVDISEQLLYEFESLIDQELDSSQIWNLPLRSVFSALFMMVDGLVSRGEIERAGSLISQISLLSGFFQKCTLEIGSSAEDALSVIGQPTLELLRQVVVYARFCELM